MRRSPGYVAWAFVAVLCAGLVLLRGARQERATGKWIVTGNMTAARSGACSAPLPDGRILVTGGTDSTGPLASTELFNADGSFSNAAPMSYPRSRHTCVALEDGGVLVAGGTNSGGTLNVAELYDPASNTWRTVGTMLEARFAHTASLLHDGRVLLGGGQSAGVASSTLEIFNPAAELFEPVSRCYHGPEKITPRRSCRMGGC